MSDLQPIRIVQGTQALTNSFVDILEFLNISGTKRARLSVADIALAYITLNIGISVSGIEILMQSIWKDASANDHILDSVRWDPNDAGGTFTGQDALESNVGQTINENSRRFNFLAGFGINRKMPFLCQRLTSPVTYVTFEPEAVLTPTSPAILVEPPTDPIFLGPSESYRIQVKKSSASGTYTMRSHVIANYVDETV